MYKLSKTEFSLVQTLCDSPLLADFDADGRLLFVLESSGFEGEWAVAVYGVEEGMFCRKGMASLGAVHVDSGSTDVPLYKKCYDNVKRYAEAKEARIKSKKAKIL